MSDGSKIDIGAAAGGKRVLIDLGLLREGRLLVQGVSRSGESWLLRRLLERSWGQIQQIVLDIEGEYGSLADSFGHIVLDADEVERAGATTVARVARENRVSLIVDLSDADRDTQARLATEFLRGLVEIDDDHWKSALVVVDEAHKIAPQGASTGTPEHLRRDAVAALADLMARGSKRGLVGVVATQRLARLAKSVVAEALNVAIGRNFMDLDMHRAAALLGMNAGQAEQLRGLQPGQFLMMGDAIAGEPILVEIGAVESDHRGRSPELAPPPMLDAPHAAAIFEALPDAEIENAAAGASLDRKPRSDAWSDGQIALLREGWATGRARAELAFEIGRTPGACAAMASSLGLTGPSPKRPDTWTDEEIAIVRAGYAEGLQRREILARLPDPDRRSISGIGWIAGELGLNMAPRPWSDEEVETMRAMVADGATPNEVAEALGRPRGGVNAAAGKYQIYFRQPWRPAEYEILRRRHQEGVRLVDVARELDRPYANVAKIAERMALSFRVAGQPNRQTGAQKPMRVPVNRLIELAEERHAVVEKPGGGYILDGMYSYSVEQLVACVNRERQADGEGPIAVAAEAAP